MLTDVVIGSFTSASLLDVLAPDGGGKASERLIGLGLAAYLPTGASGANDWADTEVVDDTIRRAGFVHATGNLLAATLYIASLRSRRRGHRGRGAALGLAGLTVLMGGGYLGGHLSLSKGVGPDQTVFDPGPTDWTPAADASLLVRGRHARAPAARRRVHLRHPRPLLAPGLLAQRRHGRGCGDRLRLPRIEVRSAGRRAPARSCHSRPAELPGPREGRTRRDPAIAARVIG
jgi:hypothetical protein